MEGFAEGANQIGVTVGAYFNALIDSTLAQDTIEQREEWKDRQWLAQWKRRGR
jgi:hypothetical protein